MRRSPTLAFLVGLGLAWPSVGLAADASLRLGPAEQYQSGLEAYESGDYRDAIDQWEAADRAMQGATPRSRAILRLDIATAYERLYDQGGDRAALEAAAALTRAYLDAVPSSFEPAEVALEQQRARDRLARIDGKLAQRSAAPPGGPGPDLSPPDPGRDRDTSPPESRAGRGMMAGGGVLLGLGIGGLGAMTAGMLTASRANDFGGLDPEGDLAEREAQIQRGKMGNTIAVSGAIASAVLIPTGIALLAAGGRRRSKARRATARVAPVLGPGQAGLALGGRF